MPCALYLKPLRPAGPLNSNLVSVPHLVLQKRTFVCAENPPKTDNRGPDATRAFSCGPTHLLLEFHIPVIQTALHSCVGAERLY
jgi:hypothetical protein